MNYVIVKDYERCEVVIKVVFLIFDDKLFEFIYVRKKIEKGGRFKFW